MLHLRHGDDKEPYKLFQSLFIYRNCLRDTCGSRHLTVYLFLPKSNDLLGVALSSVVQTLFQDVEEDSKSSSKSSAAEKNSISKRQELQTHQEVEVYIHEFLNLGCFRRTIFFRQMQLKSATRPLTVESFGIFAIWKTGYYVFH